MGAIFHQKIAPIESLNKILFHIRRKLNLALCDDLRENDRSRTGLSPLKGATQGCLFGVKAKDDLVILAKLDPSDDPR